MEIRTAVLSDADEITALWKEMMTLHQCYDKYFTIEEKADKAYKQFAEENIRNGSNLFKVCCDDKNKIIGYVLAVIFYYPPIYPDRRYLEIIEMVVTEDQRRKKIGKFMLNDVSNWAKENNITRMECMVAIGNPISQGFWKKNGFRAYAERLVSEI